MEACCRYRAKKHWSGFSSALRFLGVLLLFLRGNYCQSPCTNELTGTPLRCMPSFGNAAFGKLVISNNTCGTPPSEFCVDTGVTSPTKECEICDATKETYRHPAFYITDIKDDQNSTWWQSETLLDNPDKPVTLTLDLGKSFDVSYISIRFRSPRPESMALYKRTSTDPNEPWIPYQYFSASCEKTYKVKTNDIARTNQQVLCSDEFSSILPLTGGNVAFTTLQGRPDSPNFDSSVELQEWVTASAIRIDLDRMNTFGDEVFGDPNVLRSYYFAITDLTVGGRCKCNGHAAKCMKKQVGSGQFQLQCLCDHRTTGVDCEKCQPLYNNRPWARATEDSANECISDCSYELGMQSKGILDGSISASSTLSADHVPGFARLDEPQGAWCSATNDNSPYVQIQLSEEKLITKMMTQGSLKDLRWSMEYQIKYLKEGKWITYQKADGGLTLEGNRNVQSLKEHVLQPPIRTSSIRIYPMAPESVMPNMTLDKVSCLRLELYGCSATGETRKCFGRICSGTSNQISGQDAYNSGAWGAPRGNGTHRGIDIVCSVGSEVYAPFPAEVIREAKLYGSGHRLYKEPFNTGIYLQGTGEWNVYKVVLFYMRKEVSNGTKVSEGSYIGRMLNRAAGRPGMTNVIHVDLYKNGKRVNPTPYVC